MAEDKPRTEAESEPKSRILIQASDRYGNTLFLTRERWLHIRRHPEMREHLTLIERVLHHPTVISKSAANPLRYIFDGHGLLAPRKNIIRVVVEYPQPDIRDGSMIGTVMTAYGPLVSRTGNGGEMVYFAGSVRRTR